MLEIGSKIMQLRKAKNWSQGELAEKIEASRAIIGKYERDEMLPSIKAAKSIAKLIDTTVGYLLGESEQTNVLKDPSMLQRLNQISNLSDDDKHCILYTLDGLLQNVRTQQAFAK